MLSALDPTWGAARSVAWVVAAQGISGVAKDLTKTASKSAIKATSQQGAGQLFRWVAWFTGSKNAMKGFGFFVGGALLQFVGFRPALWLLVWLCWPPPWQACCCRCRASSARPRHRRASKLMAKSRGVNLLAGARIFMFGSRDVWFVVGLPVFLYSQGWHYVGVSTFLAAWTIGYGGVQALAPSVVRRSEDGLSREVPEARLWAAALTAIPAAIALLLATGDVGRPDVIVVVGLAVFGFAFAVNSSLHSYLILAYAGSEKAAEDVGFYYAANAGGRLFGILLSGILTQWGGLQACLWGSAAMLAACMTLTFMLPLQAQERRIAV
ncbi:organoarsenical effux MFS transporter ArsJ [Dankookia sp. P2]|uniref:organoarsenical effux MFS transporter ArsJ n=1 Tax=Dankookia sp. P2 TaxID=3423955 RepID=UPI003D67A3CA